MKTAALIHNTPAILKIEFKLKPKSFKTAVRLQFSSEIANYELADEQNKTSGICFG